LQLAVDAGAALNALGRRHRLEAGRERTRRFGGKPGRKGLDVVDHRPDVLFGQQLVPPEHRRAVQTSPHAAQQIVVGRNAAGLGRADLVTAGGEVARPRHQQM
jgi:hypothetical protein